MFGPLVGLFAVCTWQTHQKNVSGSLLDRLKAQFAKSDSTHTHVCMLIRLLWSLQVAALKNGNFITGLIVIHICSCNGNNFGLFLKRAVLGFSVACQFVFDGQVVVSNLKKKKKSNLDVLLSETGKFWVTLFNSLTAVEMVHKCCSTFTAHCYIIVCTLNFENTQMMVV